MKPDIDALRTAVKHSLDPNRILALCDYAEKVEKELASWVETRKITDQLREQLVEDGLLHSDGRSIIKNKQISDLTAQLEEAQKENARLTKSLSTEDIAREANEKHIAVLGREITDLTAQLDKAQRNLGTVCEQLEEAQKEIERLKDA